MCVKPSDSVELSGKDIKVSYNKNITIDSRDSGPVPENWRTANQI